MTYQRGDIVLVPFPFTDLSRQKARPAVVLSSMEFHQRSGDVILAEISSKVPDQVDEFELVLSQVSPEFAPTGLRVSSVVKAGKLVTLNQSLVYVKLGKLTTGMLQELDKRIAHAVGLAK